MDLEKILSNGQQQQMLGEQFGQEQKYRIQNISVQVSSTYHQLNFDNCRFQATQTSVALVLAQTQETEKAITFMFSNMSSVGLQGGNIMIFLQGHQNEDQQEDIQGQEHPMPQIFKLIQQSSDGTFNLSGNLTVLLDFKGETQQKKKELHDFLVGYLESDQIDQDENLMDEMISADQINEDGTINNFNLGDEEDEDEEEDQNDDKKMEDQTKK